MSFIRTGLREMGLKIRRQKTRMALRHEKRVLQKSEIALGREGVSQAVNFPEVRNEIVALKKLEQEQKEVALRISTIEEGIRKIELQRENNAKEQNAALAKLEEQKKPITQSLQEAKSATELCDRELASVERRLQENDAADNELLKKLAELHAQVPPPEDLDAQMAGISARRVRLPEEKAEVTRARLGAAEACRAAREKLAEQEAAIAGIDKNIAKVREEYEARDRVLNEQSRTQQEALKEARSHHQIVEEKKNPAYLNIGRHLASQGIAPPNAPHLLVDVQKHRAAVERHSQHTAELAVLSSQIDKQELRKFYFAVFSVVVVMFIIVALVFQSPQKREWLPQETDTILSINLEQLEKEDLPKRWRKDQALEWQNVWSGLIANAQRTPVLKLQNEAVRVTRALTASDTGPTHEYTLVEARTDVSRVVKSIEHDTAFERRTITGLPIWLRPDFALARVGPRTLAIGNENEVASLARVRLGIDPDLKITGPLFDRFQQLKEANAVRLVSSEPAKLNRMFPPVFPTELLDSCDIFGLSLTLQNPVKARIIIKAKSSQAAADLVGRIRNEPQRFFKLVDSDSSSCMRSRRMSTSRALTSRCALMFPRMRRAWFCNVSQKPGRRLASPPTKDSSLVRLRILFPAILLQIVAVSGLVFAEEKDDTEFVDIRRVEKSIVIDLRYATANNVAHSPLYPADAAALVRVGVARRLVVAQEYLRKQGFGLKIWDAYRPQSAQEKLWETTHNRSFVADPKEGRGSMHMRGAAVDATLVDAEGGDVAMPTDFDSFTPAALLQYAGRDATVRSNLKLLQKAMAHGGFYGLRTEWWHFCAPDWKRFSQVPNQPMTLP